MATIQLGNTKVASKLISYCEKKAIEKSGLECNPEYAKTQFKATRELWGKTEGIQAHHVIQSFKPGEITPEMANKVGRDLAKELAKGHEVLIYTHADTKHIHNHIVINSVNFEDGHKYQLHGKQAIERVRELSDEVCKERDLSIVKEPSAEQRYHRAEYGLAERGIMSWKDEIRQVVKLERQNSTNYEEFKNNLTEKYGIEVKERGQQISYRHPDAERFVRGKTLGLEYERGTIEDGFNRQVERGKGQDRETEPTRGFAEGNERTQQAHAELHQGADERGHSNSNDDRPRTRQNSKDQSRDSGENAFDFGKAREQSERLRQQTVSGYGDWKERNENEQSNDIGENGSDRGNSKNRLGKDERGNEKQLEYVIERDYGPSL